MEDDSAFWNTYQSLIDSRQIRRQDQHPLICRFCGKAESEVSFKMEPHAIPELLGDNAIIAGDECDSCNKCFSGDESHLARFLGPYLTMGHVKGKRRVPQFESRSEPDIPSKTIIESVESGKRKVWLDDIMDYKVDHEKKIMSLTFRVASIRPLRVYRALVKIGLSLLPKSELARYQNVFAWLKDPEMPVAAFYMLFITVLTKRKFPIPYVELFIAKNSFESDTHVPGLTMVLGSGQTFLQIFLPEGTDYDSNKMQDQDLSVKLFPGMLLDVPDPQGKYQVRYYDLSSPDPITFDEQINFRYESGTFGMDESKATN